MIQNAEELKSLLTACQQKRETTFRCELAAGFSAGMTDAALVELLVTGLPMAQGIEQRIVRSRGRGAVVSGKVHYREGVRMLDHYQGRKGPLTDHEWWRLADACDLCMEAVRLEGEEARFRFVFDWVCRHIRYAHTAPGQKGYERLVGAAGALENRQANCQGFADLLYLLCGICGVEAQYRCGRGERRLHVWNAVKLGGQWREVDASKAARQLRD